MSTSSLLTFAALPVVVAGIALGAAAQSPWQQPEEQPVSARDKAMVEATFAKADVSGDGQVSRDEAAAWPGVAARFEVLDRDGDGRLSLVEFAGSFVAPD